MSKKLSVKTKTGATKKLVIMRHGKAERLNLGGDHSRALTSRGHRNATEMGGVIADMIGVPDAIIASDAVRARETAEDVARAVGFDGAVSLESTIYAASLEQLVRIIRQIDDSHLSVVIVGHNPEFEELIQWLAETESAYEHLPTSGLALAEIETTTWREFGEAPTRLSALSTPSRTTSVAPEPSPSDSSDN